MMRKKDVGILGTFENLGNTGRFETMHIHRQRFILCVKIGLTHLYTIQNVLQGM